MSQFLIDLIHVIDKASGPCQDHLKKALMIAMAEFVGESEWVSMEETHMAVNGSKLMAIKSYKDRTKCGLKEAKDMVEAAMREFAGKAA